MSKSTLMPPSINTRQNSSTSSIEMTRAASNKSSLNAAKKVRRSIYQFYFNGKLREVINSFE